MDSPKKLGPFESGLSRRKVLQGGAAAVAAGAEAPLLAACGSSSPSKASSGGSSGKTQLTLMSWEMFEPTETKAWHKVVDEFMVKNPSIEANRVGWPFADSDQTV